MLPLLAIGKEEKVLVRGEDYMHKLVEQGNIYFIATGKIKETRQIITAMKVITMHNPKLIVKVRLCTPLLPLLYIRSRVSQTGIDEGTDRKVFRFHKKKTKYFIFFKLFTCMSCDH